MHLQMSKHIDTQSRREANSPNILKGIWKQREFQLFVLIPMVFVFVFNYLPMAGLLISFQKFSFRGGLLGSEWVGLKHFIEFVNSSSFSSVLINTVSISFLKILFCFPLPIFLAILLTELKSVKTRNVVQGISYLPHFMSWVICYGVLLTFFSKQDGIINQILLATHIIDKPISFFGESKWFWPLLIITENWKEVGWGSLIYVATILGIDPQIVEASVMDGAQRRQRLYYITLPHLLPIIAILLILAIGNILNAGFDQIFVLTNPLVADKSRIIDMYVYEVGLKMGRYDFATAVGLFKSFIGFFLVWSSNWFANKFEVGMF